MSASTSRPDACWLPGRRPSAPNEYKLLQVLLHHAGKLSRNSCCKQVWEAEHLDEPQYLRVFAAWANCGASSKRIRPIETLDH
jgi:DNA-binding response OmpR family regulator